jgi:peptidoglycan LD-endopeptidase LytH
MSKTRTTTLAVIVSSFIAGAIAMMLVVLTVVDHATVDGDLERISAAASPGHAPERTVVVEERTNDRESLDELRSRALLVPVDGVDERSLRSSFRDARSEGRVHEALDILAARNTPVRAVADGTIAKLFSSKAGGLTVYEFDVTERYAFYYAHLERYAPGLAEQMKVKRGQTLGFVGTSGNAPPDRPHLHFAIFKLGKERHWWQGDAIDPFDVWRR